MPAVTVTERKRSLGQIIRRLLLLDLFKGLAITFKYNARALIEPRLHPLPQLVRDDPQLRRWERDPLRFWARALFLGSAPDRLLAPVPDNLAPVEGPVQQLLDARRRPAPPARGLHV